jgi:hypothetical protein
MFAKVAGLIQVEKRFPFRHWSPSANHPSEIELDFTGQAVVTAENRSCSYAHE